MYYWNEAIIGANAIRFMNAHMNERIWKCVSTDKSVCHDPTNSTKRLKTSTTKMVIKKEICSIVLNIFLWIGRMMGSGAFKKIRNIFQTARTRKYLCLIAEAKRRGRVGGGGEGGEVEERGRKLFLSLISHHSLRRKRNHSSCDGRKSHSVKDNQILSFIPIAQIYQSYSC